MRIIRWTSFSLVLAAAALLTGCGTMDMDDVYGRDRGPRDPYYDRAGNLQGTVERVNPRDRLIVVNRGETDGRYDLRNGQDDRRDDGDRVFLYYDDRTTVEYQGRTFAPQNLEPGDRIQVNDVDDRGDRLIAQDIQVLYDVSSGDQNSGPYDNRDNRGGREDRGDRSNPYDRNDQNDRNDQSDQSATDLRGTVRTVNTRDHTVEIEPSDSRYDSNFSTGQSDVVVVRYNSRTSVEFEGRRYEPGNLERGDVVEIQARRDPDGLLLAEQITVVGEGQPVRR
jgi:hypothetical protein